MKKNILMVVFFCRTWKILVPILQLPRGQMESEGKLITYYLFNPQKVQILGHFQENN